VLSRFASQSKTKESSALREDAFQLHEARKLYIKASMDLCIFAPQVRSTIDKLLVRICSDQWRDTQISERGIDSGLRDWGPEMERIRSWSRDMEGGEKVFKRELQAARKEIELSTEETYRPSRELEHYAVSTVPFLTTPKGPSSASLQKTKKESEAFEKQGWLFMRTVSGKPARTAWIRRWFFVKNGIFGWLVQGVRSGGVEESERIGVLLCNVKPAFQEERRFCFEVKTKDATILLQAEVQSELTQWLDVFEVAKRTALEAASNTSAVTTLAGGEARDAAFTINPPSAPEFAAKVPEISHHGHGSDDLAAIDRSLTIPRTEDLGGLATRSSFDVSQSRRSTTGDKEESGDRNRDHAARLMQKLDLRGKSSAAQTPTATGIAGLIASSHNVFPVGAIPPMPPPLIPSEIKQAQVAVPLNIPVKEHPPSSLAPTTLANPPAPTNLSKTAVIISGERNIFSGTGNVWGSNNWGLINRIERGSIEPMKELNRSVPPSPNNSALESPPKDPGSGSEEAQKTDDLATQLTSEFSKSSPGTVHRKTMSLQSPTPKSEELPYVSEQYPANYPSELRTQDAQFKILFSDVPRQERALLVFRATWNPNDQQDFPGRIYVTSNSVYFYSHHQGLILVASVGLGGILEVAAATGPTCDYIILHLSENSNAGGYTRIVAKIFLENLRLLHRRLNMLVRNFNAEEPLGTDAMLDELLKTDQEDNERSPDLESWEEVSLNTPIEDGSARGQMVPLRQDRDMRSNLLVDRGLNSQPRRHGKEVTRFRLPAHPVVHVPPGMDRLAVERDFDVSPKALFHTLFGDKSAVFQTLYGERRAQRIQQQPWVHLDGGHMRREYRYQIDYSDWFGSTRQANIVDDQTIEKLDDHLCYEVTDRKTPWHLPHRKDFMLVSKIVITYLTKSKGKLAIYTKVEWTKPPKFSKAIVDKQALDDLESDALDLADVVADQVRKLGSHARTKKAVAIFGQVGQQTNTFQVPPDALAGLASRRVPITQRTLATLVGETLASLFESAITSIMMWSFSAVAKLWKIARAHDILLSILGISIFFNLFYTSRDTSEWWSERNAGKFMARIGVGPNQMMSRAIYLHDIEGIVSNRTDILGEAGNRW
jgi:VAD1 Analog of StAR-related lipid transfer domain/PH domain